MVEILIFSVFFGLLIVGAIITNAMGRLPSAEELAAQDQARWASIRRSREP